MSLINLLAEKTEQSTEQVEQTLSNASRKYKVFSIAKRGGAGYRVIAQPARELKKLQRGFVELFPFPVHDCVKAYRRGIGIKDNVTPHSQNRFLLKTDFQSFFHSIKPKIFWSELETIPGISYKKELLESKTEVESLLFWRPARRKDGKLILSIGAPSSPAISNFCLYSFDLSISKWCEQHGVVYTRYADDLTFSTNIKGMLQKVYLQLKFILRTKWTFLTLNESKTVFASKKTNRHVTGIVINNEGGLSLGRGKKRKIKGLVYRLKCKQITYDEFEWLRGYLNFIIYADPAFFETLKKKYSSDFIMKIRCGEYYE